MGVPSVSFFAGSRLLAVDQSLVDAGKMYFSRDVASIMRYLDGAKSGEAMKAAPKDAGSEFWKQFK
jgi:predicted glycosyltransferase